MNWRSMFKENIEVSYIKIKLTKIIFISTKQHKNKQTSQTVALSFIPTIRLWKFNIIASNIQNKGCNDNWLSCHIWVSATFIHNKDCPNIYNSAFSMKISIAKMETINDRY